MIWANWGRRNRKVENLIIAVIVSVIFFLIAYNLYRVEYRKAELVRLAEEQDRIEKLEQELRDQQQQLRENRLEEIGREKEEKAVEIIDFHQQYVPIVNNFLGEIERISGQMEGKFINIEHVKELTRDRIEATKNFKQSLNTIDLPQTLNSFYDYQANFLDHDFETWSFTYAYYNSKRYSTYDTQELDNLHKINEQLFKEAEQELEKVYIKYGLEDLLADFARGI